MKKLLIGVTTLYYFSLTPLFFFVFSNTTAGWLLLTVYVPMILMVFNSFLFNEKLFVKGDLIRVNALVIFFCRIMILLLLLGHLIIGGAIYLAIALFLLATIDLAFMNGFIIKYQKYLIENKMEDPFSSKALMEDYEKDKDLISSKPKYLKLKFVTFTKIFTIIIIWEPRFYEFAFRNLITSIIIITLYSILTLIILISSYRMISLSTVYDINKRYIWTVLIFASDFLLVGAVVLSNHFIDGLGTFELIILIALLYAPYLQLWAKIDKQYMSGKKI